MGLIQNKVKVSQPNSHVVVKNAGGLRGLTGETGPQGPQGVPGQAATVTAGTTTTLPAGSDATVQNVGSTSAAIFNFGIPKGDKGDTGESGAAATISVGTTTTLEPGEDATVTNSGTSSAAVFNFGIPKGAKGDTGSQGPAGQDGADGFSPTAKVSKTGDTATITITDKDGTTTAQISDGVTPTIDPALSPTSENPVQNKVVTNALVGKADKPIIVSSLPETGTAGQEYLVDDRYNTVTELKGDTQQQAYSGKNLFNSFKITSSTGSTTKTVDENGVIYLSNNSYGNGYCPTGITLATFAPNLVAGQSYYIYVDNGFGDGGRNYIYLSGSSSFWNSGSAHTVTQAELDGSVVVYGGYQATTSLVVMITVAQDSNYEKYVGGTASPNPDYPQEVQTVTGEQTVTVVGKNLAKLTDCSLSDTGYTLTTVNGSVVLTSASKNSFFDLGAGVRTGNWIPDYNSSSVSDNHLTPADNGTYTLSLQEFQLSVTGTQNLYFSIFTNTREMRITISPTATSFTPYTFTLNNGEYVKTLGIWTGESDSAISNKFKVQLEKNSQPTSYAPYQGGSYPVNLGKNLFDKDSFPSVDGFIRADNYTLTSSASNKTTYIQANPNTTYTFSGFALGVALVVGTFNKVPALGDVANARVLKGASDTTVTITTGASDRYIAFMYKTSSDTLDTSAFQIEKGSSVTTYAPYFTPIELCKIGTYQDYIYKSGDDWYVHKDIDKLIVSFSSKSGSTANNQFSTTVISDILAPSSAGVVSKIMSNRFISKSPTYIYANDTTGIGINTNQTITIGFGLSSGIDTVEKANTYASSNEIVAYYALATPTDTQITDATLISQLEALAGAKIMVDGGTATVTSQYLPATLTTAYSSNSGYIDYIYDGTNFVKVR